MLKRRVIEAGVRTGSVDIALGARTGIPLFRVLMSYESHGENLCDMSGSIDTEYIVRRSLFAVRTVAKERRIAVIRGHYILHLTSNQRIQ